MRKGARERGEAERKESAHINRQATFALDLGLGGIFKGLATFVELLEKMASEGADEVTRTGELRGPGRTRAMYGFTVKIGAEGLPRVEGFGNVRETEVGPVVEEVREPMVDVFDEGNDVVVIAEIPGVEESDVKLEIREDILLLSASDDGHKYSKEVLLPCPVLAATMQSSYRNGILEVRLSKASSRKGG